MITREHFFTLHQEEEVPLRALFNVSQREETRPPLLLYVPLQSLVPLFLFFFLLSFHLPRAVGACRWPATMRDRERGRERDRSSGISRMSATIARLHSHLSVHKAQVFSGTRCTHKFHERAEEEGQEKAKESGERERKAREIERCVYAPQSDFFLILTTQASSFLFSTVYYALHSAHKSVSTSLRFFTSHHHRAKLSKVSTSRVNFGQLCFHCSSASHVCMCVFTICMCYFHRCESLSHPR